MSDSETESFRNQTNDITKLGASLLKVIKFSEKHLEPSTVENLLERMSKVSSFEEIINEYENFASSLISKIQSIKQHLNINIEKGDYENLQSAIQKAEAEIRGHIKIQQQLKIYMDGLQQRVDQLQKQIKSSQDRYRKLYETLRAMDLEKKQLKKKLSAYQTKIRSYQNPFTDSKMPAHKHSKVISEQSANDSQSSLQKVYLQKARATRIKSIIPKYSQKKHKLIQSLISEQGSNKNRHLKSELQISMIQLDGTKKQETNKFVTKQPTRTIRLKETGGKSQTKSGKYLQSSAMIASKGKRQARSNSVCS